MRCKFQGHFDQNDRDCLNTHRFATARSVQTNAKQLAPIVAFRVQFQSHPLQEMVRSHTVHVAIQGLLDSMVIVNGRCFLARILRAHFFLESFALEVEQVLLWARATTQACLSLYRAGQVH